MVENKQDVLARVYAMLVSLRKNIAEIGAVEEKYVREFHAVLDRIEGIEIDVSEFRIPDSELQPHITMTRFGSGGAEHSYSKEKYVEKAFILTKLDAILGYFEIITSEKPRSIGFHPPDK
jgi:hypothetical protein